MTNTNAIIPVEHDYAVRLDMAPAHQSDDRRWDEQISLIKRAGAEFDRSARSWYVWLNDPVLSAARLEHLWRAVIEYGASVRITAVEPPAAAPAATTAGEGEPEDTRQLMARMQRVGEAVAAKPAARRNEPTQQ